MPAKHGTIVLLQLLRDVMVLHSAILFVDHVLRAYSNKTLTLLRRKIQCLFVGEVLDLLLFFLALRWHFQYLRGLISCLNS